VQVLESKDADFYLLNKLYNSFSNPLNSDMYKSGLIFFKITKNNYASKYIKEDAGFTLVEVIAVTLMIGILAVIAIPNWLGFMSRQRVGKANDVVLAALQEAQRQAKQKKLSYSVSFKVENQVPKIVVHPDSTTASSVSSEQWKPIGESSGIQSGQITFFTNLTSKNTAGTSVNTNTTFLSNPQTIAFDYMGTLPNANFGTLPTGSTEYPGLKIVVATPNGNTKRCVIVKTILGSTLTAKDSQCN
jgi:prepilin-type N-terminal cleavage/methylation domain-containing protein